MHANWCFQSKCSNIAAEGLHFSAFHFLLLCSFYSTTHFVFLLGKLCNILPRQLNYACIATANRCYTGETETSLAQFVYLNAAACAQLFLGSTMGMCFLVC